MPVFTWTKAAMKPHSSFTALSQILSEIVLLKPFPPNIQKRGLCLSCRAQATRSGLGRQQNPIKPEASELRKRALHHLHPRQRRYASVRHGKLALLD